MGPQSERENSIIWRIGYQPAPLSWAGWQHASGGRFPGRWDDPNGNFRTLYVGESLLACFLEVLAFARADEYLAAALEDIEEDVADAADYPTISIGTVSPSWLAPRRAVKATLDGRFCHVTAAETVAYLYPRFIGMTLAQGHDDFDAGILKNGAARSITQAVSASLYLERDIDGLRFTSRHGDELTLWCIYERPGDPPVSPHLFQLEEANLQEDHPEILEAFRLLNLRWAT